MSPWKILFIGVLACVCFALAVSTVLVPISHTGSHRWLWLGGLLVTTLFAIAIFAAFLRYASLELDERPRGAGR